MIEKQFKIWTCRENSFKQVLSNKQTRNFPFSIISQTRCFLCMSVYHPSWKLHLDRLDSFLPRLIWYSDSKKIATFEHAGCTILWRLACLVDIGQIRLREIRVRLLENKIDAFQMRNCSLWINCYFQPFISHTQWWTELLAHDKFYVDNMANYIFTTRRRNSDFHVDNSLLICFK